MAQEFIIGDTFETTYTFYNPAAGSTPENPVADYDSPIDLSPFTISLTIAGDRLTKSFPADGARVAVNNAQGTVTVALPVADTQAFARCEKGKSYLNFVDGAGKQKSKAWRDLVFIKKTFD